MKRHQSIIDVIGKISLPLIVVGLFLVAATTSYTIFQSSRFNRPTDYIYIELVTERPIYPGDLLTFRSYRKKYRVCPIRVDRAILTVNQPHRIISTSVELGGFSPVGLGYIEFSLYLPIDIAPGDYIFTQNITTTCGDTVFSDATNPVMFHVSEWAPASPN